jgi:hypothetical protein
MNVGLARLAATGNALEASRLELRTLHARSIDHQKRLHNGRTCQSPDLPCSSGSHSVESARQAELQVAKEWAKTLSHTKTDI